MGDEVEDVEEKGIRSRRNNNRNEEKFARKQKKNNENLKERQTLFPSGVLCLNVSMFLFFFFFFLVCFIVFYRNQGETLALSLSGISLSLSLSLSLFFFFFLSISPPPLVDLGELKLLTTAGRRSAGPRPRQPATAAPECTASWPLERMRGTT